MNPFDVYCLYLAIKNHFTKKDYNFFKYLGKVKANSSSFNKRKDKYFFEKMSRQKTRDELINYFVANFIECSDPGRLWVGEIMKGGEENYQNWKKRKESLFYLFKSECSDLFQNHEFDKVFECTNGNHPIVLKQYIQKNISIETITILNQLLRFTKDYDKILSDPFWDLYSLRIKKYSSFLDVDLQKYKQELLSLVKNTLDSSNQE